MLIGATTAHLYSPIIGYMASDIDDNESTRYYGFVNKDGAWYIMEEITSTDPKTYRYISGSSDYTTSWTGRASLGYDYAYNVFL